MLRKLKVRTRAPFPKGVYFHGDDLHRVGIVVATELPRDRSTLLVRIMAAGRLLPDAIADLAELPEARAGLTRSVRPFRPASPRDGAKCGLLRRWRSG